MLQFERHRVDQNMGGEARRSYGGPRGEKTRRRAILEAPASTSIVAYRISVGHISLSPAELRHPSVTFQSHVTVVTEDGLLRRVKQPYIYIYILSTMTGPNDRRNTSRVETR